ncbi:PEP-CTERM sorting domain-containing protein [Paremcibacter congregatus]|uniref:PEP-CTERM sorting domain-containing protein n=1 Tax=Paremcibacter congregatus TaxID=2043170 RepID=UPI0030ECE4F2|tara:strand:- start:9962 stop:10726 length:765 start_codon:yes stop_codon:yes gene_type:complete
MKKFLVSSIAAITAMMSSASAAVVQIDAFSTGWYDSVLGFHYAWSNTTAGRNPAFGSVFRDYFAFDLSSIAGLPGNVRNVKITFRDIEGKYDSIDPTETFQLSSFEGDIDDLISENFTGGADPYDQAGGLALYSDLGDGDVYGTRVIKKPGATVFPNGFTVYIMDEFTMALSSSAVDNMNAALASLDQRFAIGGQLTSLSDRTDFEAIFSASQPSFGGPAFITVEVPEPAPVALLGLGLLGIAAVRRQRLSRKA